MGLLHDIDIFGRENPDGTAMEHIEEDAIQSALTLWLTSTRGDFILDPTLGGIFDQVEFKGMSPTRMGLLHFKLKNAINNEFAPDIRLTNLEITPIYEDRVLQIDISYISERTGEEQTLTIYTKDTGQQKSFRYEEIEYIEENLRNFVLVKLSGMAGKKLLYDSEKGVWKWGKYLLINLTPADPYFDEILAIINT